MLLRFTTVVRSARLLLPMLGFLGMLLPGRLSAQDVAPTGMAKRLIERFRMERIPQEGAWFAVTYVSTDQLDGAALPARYGGKPRAAGSLIYAVATAADFSAMHRLQTDETWHFYGGNPLEMLLLHPDGRGETVVLGPDVLGGQHAHFTVPRGVWQGARPLAKDYEGPEAYAFFGCTLAPAFDYADFEIGYRDELTKAFPKFAEAITRLTRPEFVKQGPATSP